MSGVHTEIGPHKSSGSTTSERYLAKLCEGSFLTLWSYPNVYRDQGKGQQRTEGKELCDLLVCCGRDVIIFSDKSCAFPNTGKLDLDWKRWYCRAILQSAKQLYGAERWMRRFPERIFLDRACNRRFPLPLPNPREARIHRIVVASGAKERCRSELGGSGSLVICPSISADAHMDRTAPRYAPFYIGDVDPERGFVHVLDEVTLDIVLRGVDTITDFLWYLQEKEAFIRSGQLGIVPGEENLLSYYLTHTGSDGKHAFVVPEPYARVAIEDGHWNTYLRGKDYAAKKAADKPSYKWDEIIEEFTEHLMRGTLREEPHVDFGDSESALRMLAEEPRFQRRMLANALLTLYRRELSAGRIAIRSVLSSINPSRAYVFVLAAPNKSDTYERYREWRKAYLGDYCFVAAYKFQDLKEVVGIASEPEGRSGASLDLALFRNEGWTPELKAHAEAVQRKWGFLFDRNLRKCDYSDAEYRSPDETEHIMEDLAPWSLTRGAHHPPRSKMGRNEPCLCRSGLKYKRCCGRRA